MNESMEVNGPRDVPNLRTHLLSNWGTGRPYRVMAIQQTLASPAWLRTPGESPVNHATAFVQTELKLLSEARLWWVSAEMTDLLMATAPAVPDEAMVKDLEVPSECGLVVFEKPWKGTDASFSGNSVTINAMSWGHTLMPPTPSRPVAERCLSVSCYRSLTATEMNASIDEAMLKGFLPPDSETELKVDPNSYGTKWSYLGRSDWPIEDELNQAPFSECPEAQVLSFIEDRRVIAAFFTLIAQEAMAETEYHPIPRPDRRRAERSGILPEANELRVVRLRRRHRDVIVDDENSEPIENGRQFSHRWVVNPFYRWQRVGVGRKDRRLTLVAGHVRGPEDKPLRIKQEVRAWVR